MHRKHAQRCRGISQSSSLRLVFLALRIASHTLMRFYNHLSDFYKRVICYCSYQPDLTNIRDNRMLGELAFQFPIREQLVFEIESALRFDSDPHLDLIPLDFSMVIGMVYSISN